MNSIATGKHPRLDDVRDAFPRDLVSSKPIQHAAARLRVVQAWRRVSFGHDPNCPQKPADQPQKIQSPRPEPAPTLDQLARPSTPCDAPSGCFVRHAYFKPMRAARIHRDITRDGTGQLRTGSGA